MGEPQGPVCQSCSMPMGSDDKFGTEADGSRNEDYCFLCYKDGAFLQPDATLEGMIDLVARFMSEKMGMTPEDAKAQAQGFIPTLKRWRE